MVQLSQLYVTIGNTTAMTMQIFACRIMSLLFNTLSSFVITFLPSHKRLQISRLQSPSTVILEPKKRKSVTTSTFSSSNCHEVMGLDDMILVFFFVFFFFLIFSLSQLFHSPPSPSSRGCLDPLYFLPLEWYDPHIWGCWSFSHLPWFQLVIHPAWHFISHDVLSI